MTTSGVCSLSTPVVSLSRVLLPSLALLVACASPVEDSAEAPGLALAAGSIAWIEPSGTQPTVATVRWSTPEPSRGQVWVRESAQEDWTIPLEETEPAEEHAWLLRGLASDTSYQVRVLPDLEDAGQSLSLEYTTGTLPDYPGRHRRAQG